jgi:hypothetical protein
VASSISPRAKQMRVYACLICLATVKCNCKTEWHATQKKNK